MDQNHLREEMLISIKFARHELETFYSSLSEEEKERRGSLQKWSARDVITHLAFWEKHLNSVLKNGLIGRKVPVVGDYLDRINDGVLFGHIDQPIEEALAEEKAAFQEFLDFIVGVPADNLLDPKKYAFLDGNALIDRALSTHVYHKGFHICDYYLKNGRLKKALKLQEKLTDMLVRFPDWKANSIYNLSCFYALNGLKEEAIEQLRLAFIEKKSLIEWSKKDSDIDPLRDMPEYQALITR